MSEAFRTLTVTVDTVAGTVSPDTPQSAGFHGDHRATRLVFQPLDSSHRYRLEIVDGAGAYDITPLLTVQDQAIAYDIPAAWTAPGTAAVRLVAVGEEEEPSVWHFPPIRLFFADREDGSAMGEMLPAWQTVMLKAQATVQRIEDTSDVLDTAVAVATQASITADGAEKTSEEAQQAAQKALSRATTAQESAANALELSESVRGVYVGSGDLPDGYAVQIDPNGEVLEIDAILARLSSLEKTVLSYQAEFSGIHADIAQLYGMIGG